MKGYISNNTGNRFVKLSRITEFTIVPKSSEYWKITAWLNDTDSFIVSDSFKSRTTAEEYLGLILERKEN